MLGTIPCGQTRGSALDAVCYRKAEESCVNLLPCLFRFSFPFFFSVGANSITLDSIKLERKMTKMLAASFYCRKLVYMRHGVLPKKSVRFSFELLNPETRPNANDHTEFFL